MCEAKIETDAQKAAKFKTAIKTCRALTCDGIKGTSVAACSAYGGSSFQCKGVVFAPPAKEADELPSCKAKKPPPQPVCNDKCDENKCKAEKVGLIQCAWSESGGCDLDFDICTKAGDFKNKCDEIDTCAWQVDRRRRRRRGQSITHCNIAPPFFHNGLQANIWV